MSHVILPYVLKYSQATGWTAKELWFNSRQRQKFFLFSKASRPAVGATQPSLHWVLRLLIWGQSDVGVKAGYFHLWPELRMSQSVCTCIFHVLLWHVNGQLHLYMYLTVLRLNC